MMKKMQVFKGRLGNKKGFTLIEVIAVLIILGIISAIAISRATGTDEANLRAEVDTLKGHLRYAQYLALNDMYTSDTSAADYATRTQWGIKRATNSYKLVKYVGGAELSTTPFNLPGESSSTHTFKAPIQATGAALILFDSWGSPYSTTSDKFTAAATITLTPGPESITITPETGFIR